MGQKTNPLGLRLGITQRHRARWYAPPEQYSYLVLEDQRLRDYLQRTRRHCGISEVLIERRGNGLRLRLSAAQVRPLVGPDGGALERLRQELQRECNQLRRELLQLKGPSFFQPGRTQHQRERNPEIQVFVRPCPYAQADASYLAEFVVSELEKRTPFRRALRLARDRAQQAGVRGLRLQVSGRLNGAEIARKEWIRQGRVPLHTLSADLDYTCKTARTIFGLLGVKVWVFRPAPGTKATTERKPRRPASRRPRSFLHLC
jgi:small subunit ribosomal protein S3